MQQQRCGLKILVLSIFLLGINWPERGSESLSRVEIEIPDYESYRVVEKAGERKQESDVWERVRDGGLEGNVSNKLFENRIKLTCGSPRASQLCQKDGRMDWGIEKVHSDPEPKLCGEAGGKILG